MSSRTMVLPNGPSALVAFMYIALKKLRNVLAKKHQHIRGIYIRSTNIYTGVFRNISHI